MMRVSLSEFIRATGRDPAHDDMERVNCMEAGTIGHLCCGWNAEHNKPQFEVGPVEWNGKFPRNSAQK